MAAIFLDESGYTGQNLLDENQPFFTIATLNIEEEAAAELKAKHFSSVQASELKFSSLSRRDRYLNTIASFINELEPDKVRAYSFHKKYVLLLKSIDYLVEPKMYDDGFNLYKDNKHIALGNLYWFLLNKARGARSERLITTFLKPFQDAIIKNDVTLLDPLEKFAQRRSKSPDYRVFNLYLRSSRAEQQEVLDALKDQLPLDLALSGAFWVMSGWRRQLGEDEPLTLYHDQSSNMAKQMEDWNFWVTDERAPFREERAAGGGVQLPIGLGSTHLVDSKTSAGVQLADVLSGAINGVFSKYWRQAPQSEIVKAVFRLEELERIVHKFPSLSVNPGELGTRGLDPNASLMYMTNELMKSHK